jgi:hypothetical protein
MNDILTGMTRGLVRDSGKPKTKKKSVTASSGRPSKAAPTPGVAALGSRGLNTETPRARKRY